MERQLKTEPVEKKPIVQVCPLCRQKLTSPYNPLSVLMEHFDLKHPKHCYCGQPLAGHPRCHGCGIYAGSDHLESQLFQRNGHSLCKGCVRMFDTIPKKFIRHPEKLKGDWDYDGMRELLSFRFDR